MRAVADCLLTASPLDTCAGFTKAKVSCLLVDLSRPFLRCVCFDPGLLCLTCSQRHQPFPQLTICRCSIPMCKDLSPPGCFQHPVPAYMSGAPSPDGDACSEVESTSFSFQAGSGSGAEAAVSSHKFPGVTAAPHTHTHTHLTPAPYKLDFAGRRVLGQYNSHLLVDLVRGLGWTAFSFITTGFPAAKMRVFGSMVTEIPASAASTSLCGLWQNQGGW